MKEGHKEKEEFVTARTKTEFASECQPVKFHKDYNLTQNRVTPQSDIVHTCSSSISTHWRSPLIEAECKGVCEERGKKGREGGREGEKEERKEW